jgi:hypothetical protein
MSLISYAIAEEAIAPNCCLIMLLHVRLGMIYIYKRGVSQWFPDWLQSELPRCNASVLHKVQLS